MIGALFSVVLRTIAIPIAAILVLQNTFLGQQGAWLAVIISMAIVNAISVIINIIKVLTNSILLKGVRVITLIISILLEIGSVIAFIILYSQRF